MTTQSRSALLDIWHASDAATCHLRADACRPTVRPVIIGTASRVPTHHAGGAQAVGAAAIMAITATLLNTDAA
ncbi:hypothetical protein FUT69_04170 [Xylella taiwanensis]|uniref:Uncharacterized protein n=1 Tax=Xylella taiwanensis TaxID=1444770 RepID=Z9JH98_9GAMM|nr:hypothetical protein [Xylella taiwanensis]AXI84410.1 hypothetical protein AB672_10960 [Xylella taiwanensis]EWS77117.1 hypothetical protein AF72_12420 [Xylella taiwanensis]MCD8455295.1 hypothetical protein [Xylella taiwanensis]MCD8457700.1 hypothetical protein [Xylella taiwanensis]MCD8459838.1 hypothetical protein [Xylella taiwanensis]